VPGPALDQPAKRQRLLLMQNQHVALAFHRKQLFTEYIQQLILPLKFVSWSLFFLIKKSELQS
jgi:hypothetical protein